MIILIILIILVNVVNMLLRIVMMIIATMVITVITRMTSVPPNKLLPTEKCLRWDKTSGKLKLWGQICCSCSLC